ncbi:hypothetical protein ACFVFS_14960 [Kitasatospora sp. NPDC057692]|uniref:hypothetical protein n=1 Tax=Kitasatospora sp. NPDC057692 TaxID=3346215 RepID=UPI0036ADA276
MEISAQQAMERAQAVGGRLANLTRRESRGAGQNCPWELVVTIDQAPEDRAAAAWIIADEVMHSRTDVETEVYDLWRQSVLAGTKLTGRDHVRTLAFAYPVFGAAAALKKGNHGLAGYVGEWLWYLITRDLPAEPGRSVEFLTAPGPTVSDSGGDGLIIHRAEGSTRGFVFRLWEMKKYTGKANKPDGAIRKGWTQLGTKGATYLGQMSWGDKRLVPDTLEFVSSLVSQWVDAEESGNGGVSVALNASATPARAFHLAQQHFTTHSHPDALKGMVVAIDDLEAFARIVRGYVWSAL